MTTRTRTLPLAILALCTRAGMALAASPLAELPDLRVQVQEIVYEVGEDGSASPIDHRIVDVFEVRFDQQYDSVDRSSGDLDFGLVYFAVPRDPGEEPNYNVYLYLRDDTHEMVADGYRNNEVPGALFKLTTMLLKRAGNRAYARLMHCVVPQAGQGESDASRDLERARARRRLHDRVTALLERPVRRVP